MADQGSVVSIAVGDHVRLNNFLANEHRSYQVSSQVGLLRESVDGLVLSIRDIATGQLVVNTTGETSGYVFEILFDNTFNPKYASARNAPRTAERATATPGWQRMRSILRDQAGKGMLLASSSPNFTTDSPLGKMLDGWKVLKVHSTELASLEKVDAEQTAE